MEDLTKGDKRSIRRGLAKLFALLGQEEGGITARWYRIYSCKNETLKPGKGSEPFERFDNPIPPLSQLFRLGEVRANKVLLACGILEPLKKGNNKGVLGVSLIAWYALREEFRLKKFIELVPVTREKILGSKVYCVRVGSFRGKVKFNAGDQADWTLNKTWKPERIRIKAALNNLFHSIALPLLSIEATVAAAEEAEEEEEAPLPATLATGEEHQAKPRAAFKTVFEVNINAAFYGPVKYKAPNGREQVLVQIPRSSTEAFYHINKQRRGWIKTILENHAGGEVESEELDVWLLEEMHRLRPKAFKEVAARQGFTIHHARMPANNTTTMWLDAFIIPFFNCLS